jgi:hypothetical protein
VWAANKVEWAHRQVGGSSSRPDPLVGGGREPGRWGPRGTHVSPDLAVVVAPSRRGASRHSRRSSGWSRSPPENGRARRRDGRPGASARWTPRCIVMDAVIPVTALRRHVACRRHRNHPLVRRWRPEKVNPLHGALLDVLPWSTWPGSCNTAQCRGVVPSLPS